MNTSQLTEYARNHPLPVTVGVLGVAGFMVYRYRKTASDPTSSTSAQVTASTSTVGATGPAGPAGPAGTQGIPGLVGATGAQGLPGTVASNPKPVVPAPKTITAEQRAKFSCASGYTLAYGRGTDTNNLICRNNTTGQDKPVTVKKSK